MFDTVESMVTTLNNYRYHADSDGTGVWKTSQAEQAAQLEQDMEKLVVSCEPAMRQLRALLRIHRHLVVMARLHDDICRERERCYQAELSFDGSMTFVTQQPSIVISEFSGPDIKANSFEEAYARADLLGLELLGESKLRDPGDSKDIGPPVSEQEDGIMMPQRCHPLEATRATE